MCQINRTNQNKTTPEILNTVCDKKRWVYARVYTPGLGAMEDCGAGSALRLVSAEGSSHWVLLSRHWVLASAWGNGGNDAAAVWSSERLFPKIADGKGSSSITGSNIAIPPRKHFPSCKHPLLFWRIYSREQQNAFRFTRCRLFQEHRLVAAHILFRLAHSFLATLHRRQVKKLPVVQLKVHVIFGPHMLQTYSRGV